MLKVGIMILFSSFPSLLYAGCEVNIDIGSDGSVYSQGNSSLRYRLVQRDQNIRQSTQIIGNGVSVSSNRTRVAGIQQHSQATHDNRWDLYPENASAAYQPCQQYPEPYQQQ